MDRSNPLIFRLAGDHALLVELGQCIDVDLSRCAQAIAQQAPAWPGVEEAVPGYASLLLLYDPLRTEVDELRQRAEEARHNARLETLPPPRTVILPVAYGGVFGPDLKETARSCGFSPDEYARRHAEALYVVHMIGFTPGFPYLGGLSPELAMPRLATPRTRVPAGSVGIAGSQTGVYPLESPGGWRLIGRTPTHLFDPRRPSPALFQAGDRLRFRPITEERFALLAKASRHGDRTWEVES